jgi:serine/threonine protein kinase
MCVLGDQAKEAAHANSLSLSLCRYLKSNAGRIKWSQRIKFMLNVAHGMRYLHDRPNPIMHRDLKLENCLITEFNVLKLTDFGESRGRKEGSEALTMVSERSERCARAKRAA